MPSDEITVYGDVDPEVWSKVNQMLPRLRILRRRRVSRREFVGELITRLIDQAVEESSRPGEE